MHITDRLALVLAATVIAGAPALAAPFSPEQAPGRLPKNVIPVSYTIAIVPNLAGLSLTGRESIVVKVREATSTIQLNSLNEIFHDVRFDGHHDDVHAALERAVRMQRPRFFVTRRFDQHVKVARRGHLAALDQRGASCACEVVRCRGAACAGELLVAPAGIASGGQSSLRVEIGEHAKAHSAHQAQLREDHRREPNGAQVDRVVALVMRNKPSVDFCGYWQRAKVVHT